VLPLPLPAGVFAAGAKLEQIAGSFSNIAGLTVDDGGQLILSPTRQCIGSTNGMLIRVKAELLTDQSEDAHGGGVCNRTDRCSRSITASQFLQWTAKTGQAKKIEGASSPLSGTSLMLPIGFHNSMETLRRQMEHRGVVYARLAATWRS
jgi:hypothetical protein